MMRRLLIGLALALVALPAAANPSADELINIFAQPCVTRFPDNAAVERYAAEALLAVMPAERLRRLLGTDPGEGWLQNTARGQYLLTVELPPYHTCAVRKVGPAALNILPAFSRTLGAWVAKQPGASLKDMPAQATTVGGLPSHAYLWTLDRGPGELAESLMVIATDIEGSGTELRLVRAVGNR
jgi:hypothetical protein